MKMQERNTYLRVSFMTLVERWCFNRHYKNV